MTTIRRLSDDDVRSIFESLHGGGSPPSHLKFSIVPVGPNGLKLSPPSFEFEGKSFRIDQIKDHFFLVLVLHIFPYRIVLTLTYYFVSLRSLSLHNRWTLCIVKTKQEP